MLIFYYCRTFQRTKYTIESFTGIIICDRQSLKGFKLFSEMKKYLILLLPLFPAITRAPAPAADYVCTMSTCFESRASRKIFLQKNNFKIRSRCFNILRGKIQRSAISKRDDKFRARCRDAGYFATLPRHRISRHKNNQNIKH